MPVLAASLLARGDGERILLDPDMVPKDMLLKAAAVSELAVFYFRFSCSLRGVHSSKGDGKCLKPTRILKAEKGFLSVLVVRLGESASA